MLSGKCLWLWMVAVLVCICVGAQSLSHESVGSTDSEEEHEDLAEFDGNLTQNETDDSANPSDNEIPQRFDDMQLWRIHNGSNLMPVIDALENDYDGIIWKQGLDYVDVSIAKDKLAAARHYLQKHNLKSTLLNANVQDLIDMEAYSNVQNLDRAAGSRRKKAIRSEMNWVEYHDLEVIYDFMQELRAQHPDITRLYTIGKSAEGRDLKVLRISENPREYKKIWIDGGIHAREWISPATVTYILKQLLTDWDNQPAYIKEKTWYIMPVMNPDGYMYSRKVNRMWRKNRASTRSSTCKGVDLNRNFDIGWTGRGSSSNPCSDIFRGSSPASEPETRAVVDFLTKRKYNLESYMTFHSYGQMMVYPWAYKAVKVKDASELQRVASKAVSSIKKETGTVYRASVTYQALSIAGGGSDDWSRAALGVKYVYTIELRDTGYHGFVLPPSQIKETGVEGYIVVDTVAKAIN